MNTTFCKAVIGVSSTPTPPLIIAAIPFLIHREKKDYEEVKGGSRP
jgi:hypothetical protein